MMICMSDDVNEEQGDPTALPPQDEINFLPVGAVIMALEQGHRVARYSWLQRGKYVVRMPGYPEGIKVNEVTADRTGLPVGSLQRFAPYYLFKDGSGVFRPWSASSDALRADDWFVVTYS